LSNQSALNAKVQEAVTVYDDYLKNKGDDKPNGAGPESSIEKVEA
jgi:hypothetical protein